MPEPTREEEESKERPPEDALGRFERLLARLIAVPKAEVDKRLRAEERKRQRRREERAR